MEQLVKASLVISKAIKNNTEIWFTQGNVLDFSTLKNNATVAVIYLDVSDSVTEDRNVVISRVNDLKSWIRSNKDKVKVNGSKIHLTLNDIYSFAFAKFRAVKISRWEEPKGMEQIVPNGLKQKSIEVRQGVFKDLLHNEEDDTYWDWQWEFKRTGKRGAYKGVDFYDKVEGSDLVEFKISK
jgi:hypothetical protein